MKRFIIALTLMGWCVFAIAGIDVKTYIPKRAPDYIITITAEEAQFFPELKEHNYLPGLIEQESCITLTNSRCFNPYSELNTKRELGIGLGQLTKAFKTDGSVRFDSLNALRDQHMSELKELNWGNIRDRVDLQIRALLLMTRDNYRKLYTVKDTTERLHMTDAAYNAGLGRVIKDRTKCSLKQGCNPQVWEDNVELTCTASQTPIPMYGNKSPCRINREHVYNVFEIRMPKYQQFYNKPEIVSTNETPETQPTPKYLPNYWSRRFYLDYFFKYD